MKKVLKKLSPLKLNIKKYSSSKPPALDPAIDFTRVSSEALESPSYGSFKILKNAPPTNISTLKNGFRIITEERKGETASVGVFVLAGSRNETKENNGVAHFFEHMNFKGTSKRSGDDLELEYELAGSQLNAHTSREYTCFQSHCLTNDIPRSVDSLSDILLNSNIDKKLVDAERNTILREKEDVETHIEEVLFDKLHECAFPNSSLGLTILGSNKNIKSITQQQILDFRKAYYIAPRMVLVGVGDINHNDFVKLAEKHFSSLSPTPLAHQHNDQSKYIGSEIRVFDDNIPFLYQSFAFKGPPLHSPDILSVNIIQILLGSWEKGMGAGKHISSNLCQHIAENNLARHVSSFNHAYSDTGLFGVQTVSDGEDQSTEDLSLRVMEHMTKLCYEVKEEELNRAKNVLKNQILSQYEGRLDDICEEIGKQMLFYGRRPSVAEMFARIDVITCEQVQQVAQKYIYDKDPVSAAIGKCGWAVDWSWLRSSTYYWRR